MKKRNWTRKLTGVAVLTLAALQLSLPAAAKEAAPGRDGCRRIDCDTACRPWVQQWNDRLCSHDCFHNRCDTVCGDCRQWIDHPACPDVPEQETPVTPETPEPDAPVLPEAPEDTPVPEMPALPEVPEQQPEDDTTPAGPQDTVNGTMSAYEKEVVRLVNEIRAENGLSALAENDALADVARLKSQDLHDLGYFDHQSPTYGSPFEMMQQFGISYRTAGENIAYGFATPAAVVEAWMNSPSHRANILNATYTELGVGHVADGGYWTQMFRS